ncbi:uncharacterized protein LOC117607450 [Osmia lignaria lignaria]|uniref:uncharacterized protein LOC117607450 n=1 Tax=Osmia lignaria lignaria TaxID=1437193 RepID=UPI001478B66A|nr:uncharacterized protein LOC117607450 [Osmia lignaria]
MDDLFSQDRPFHPKDPAYGALNFDIGALNETQIKKLNLRKATERYNNDIYLKKHPEIRGLIAILLRHVLHVQPSMDVHETIGEFFNRPRDQILMDLLEYGFRTGQTFNIKTRLPASRNIDPLDNIQISCPIRCNK